MTPDEQTEFLQEAEYHENWQKKKKKKKKKSSENGKKVEL